MSIRANIVPYLAILASCVAGIMHFAPWAMVASASVLALVSIVRHHDTIASRLGTSGRVQVAMMASTVINASAVSAAAYLAGTLIRSIGMVG